MLGYDPNSTIPLADILGANVNMHWNEYLEYWEVNDHLKEYQFSARERDIHKQLDRVGEALRKNLNTLVPDPASDKQVREFWQLLGVPPDAHPDTAATLRALHDQPLVRDCVSISIAFEATDTLLPTAVARAADLVTLLADRHISDRALEYLRRATRLHLWGFDTECAILCRSVLEAALTTRLEEDIELDEPPPPLERLIGIAGKRGLFPGYRPSKSRRGWSAKPATPLADAEALRRLGNNLIHDVPVLSAHDKRLGSSLDPLRLLVGLLNLMYPHGREA